MARSIYSDKLKNRTNRLKLPIKKKPYKLLIAPGIFLCYRRCAGPGTWSVEAGWLKRFALADDHENANNKSVMSFYQAQAHALKMVRGTEGGDSDKPITVDEALSAYETDLAARGGAKYNATSVRNHLSPAMLSKVVMLLTETELAAWRNGLVTKGLKLSSANRIGKSFKVALALAAKRDNRITGAAWKNGLKPLKAKGSNNPPRDNYYLPDHTILAIVRECYAEDADLGALIDVLAGTGVRESQALKLRGDDLRDDDTDTPRLMMWCSAKGRDRDPEQRSLPISAKLAATLRARANMRGQGRPLFDRLWNLSLRFRVVLECLGLDLSLTPYTLRHSSIIRQIRSNVPMRIIAFNHDTSVVEIERTYGRYLSNASDDLTRKALLADEAVPMDNVVQLARR
jgi:integrase